MNKNSIHICGAREHNLKNFDVSIPRNKISVITGVSGAGKSSLAFDTLVSEAHRKFFFTLSHYFRQFLPTNKKAKVKKILGLSPAISLSQHETRPSPLASVATATDLNELLGVLYAKYGEAYCPKHNLATQAIKLEVVADNLLKNESGLIAICAPLVEKKKGSFEKILENLAEKGFMKVYCNGEILPLSPLPKLNKETKHTLKVIVDYIRPSKTSLTHLTSSLQTAQELSEGYIEILTSNSKGQLDSESKRTYSLKKGCPDCGFSWPKLDSRFFSANSVGKCNSCSGLGSLKQDENEESVALACPTCEGTGISQKYQSILFKGKSIHGLYQMRLRDLLKLITETEIQNDAQKLLLKEIQKSLEGLNQVGLPYLNLARKIETLSLGEHQRVRLASILSQDLSGVIYVLDEPSQGLHASELHKLLSSLKKLRDKGNTLILVDHDLFLLRSSEWIIDLGPTGGKKGGYLLSEFEPSKWAEHKSKSLTAKLLYADSETKNQRIKSCSAKPEDFITLTNAFQHNLKIDSVSFLKRGINLISGVSGAGKTTLAIHTLYHNLKRQMAYKSGRKPTFMFCDNLKNFSNIKICHLIDRSPIAKTSASISATYLGIFTSIRELFASLPQAKIAGLLASDFSLRSGNGRCSECQGRGFYQLEMKFLEDTKVQCNLCQGTRYKPNVQAIKYKNKSIVDVLNFSIDEAQEFFAHQRKINPVLTACQSIGLGYLTLGQNAASFSGGESQRLKIVPFLLKTQKEDSLFIFDEPTRGLHESDILYLKNIFDSLVMQNATVIVIEHHLGLIKQADWLIDLGPGAAEEGGNLVYQGHPAGIKASQNSITAQFL